jgi:hypothetical protein
MESAPLKRNAGATIVAILAIVQGVAGILRAFQWFDAGGDLMGKGLFLLPLTGVIAIARGALIAAIALSFIIFACGLFFEQSWAKPLGIVVAVIGLLLVLSLLIQGEPLARAFPWVVIPAVILVHLIAGGAKGPDPHQRRGSAS